MGPVDRKTFLYVALAVACVGGSAGCDGDYTSDR